MDLFEGLESLGISGIDGSNLFAEEVKTSVNEKKKVTEPEVEPEVAKIYEKSYTCPVCDKTFKDKVVRGNKVKLMSTDMDLRPVYANIDVLKYDVVACPYCGYAALSRYFGPLANAHVKLLKQGICDHYIRKESSDETYSYETALERYKLTLANAVVRKAKPSEKAYICLKTAWLLRGMAEQSDNEGAYHEQEEIYLKNAYDGFVLARQSEVLPICGMDGTTFDYLIAVLAINLQNYDVAAKLISELLVNKTVSSRIKDKTRDLKEMLLKELKKKNESV